MTCNKTLLSKRHWKVNIKRASIKQQRTPLLPVEKLVSTKQLRNSKLFALLIEKGMIVMSSSDEDKPK